jgi:hypothetical protein
MATTMTIKAAMATVTAAMTTTMTAASVAVSMAVVATVRAGATYNNQLTAAVKETAVAVTARRLGSSDGGCDGNGNGNGW